MHILFTYLRNVCNLSTEMCKISLIFLQRKTARENSFKFYLKKQNVRYHAYRFQNAHFGFIINLL